ncbi:MAG: hypothetical protein HC913_19895 [Microscillaceae bacterium]|nr:hypothetical protein [Microscillaceae bacterium]
MMIAQATRIILISPGAVNGVIFCAVFPFRRWAGRSRQPFRIMAFLSLFLARTSPEGLAQNVAQEANPGYVREIIEKCAQLHEQIEHRELHLNQRLINASRLNRHLPDYFQYFEQYFYTFDPRNAEPVPLLRAVVLKRERKELLLYREFVYDLQGQLIFYEERVGNEQQSPHFIYKLFFRENRCIHILQDEAQVQFFGRQRPLPQAAQIQTEAQNWSRRFQAGFSDFQEP